MHPARICYVCLDYPSGSQGEVKEKATHDYISPAPRDAMNCRQNPCKPLEVMALSRYSRY